MYPIALALAGTAVLIFCLEDAGASVSEPVGGLGGGGHHDDTSRPQCVTDEQKQSIADLVESYALSLPPSVQLQGLDTLFNKYTFFPQSGSLWGDLFINNFVDLDASGIVRDAFCHDYSYDGHRGIDIDTVGFAEQDIGVPVYAAADGTVVIAHDGEYDRNTSWGNQPANYVVVHHGGQHYTHYYHLRNGSVAVSPGEQVQAGQQIGLMASSGVSTGPHLHFETQMEGHVIEPFTGNCRPGSSLWADQPGLSESTYIREFIITDQSLNGWSGPPFDTSRQGTFVQGTRTIYFWINLLNMGPGTQYSIRFIRPDGTTALNNGPQSFSGTYRWSWWWWYWNVDLNQTGTWHIEYTLSGLPAFRAPFTVVSSAGQIVNRPPVPITVAFDPPAISQEAVPICRVTSGILFEDPDYDAIRYHFLWKRNGIVVRDVTSALGSDVLPRQLATAGDSLTCDVTPSDGLTSGPTASATTTVFAPYPTWAQSQQLDPAAHHVDSDSDRIPDGLEYRLGLDPHRPDTIPAISLDPDTGQNVLILPPSPLSDPAVELEVMVSTNLDTWTPAELSPDGNRWILGNNEPALFARLRAMFESPVETTVPLGNLLP